MIYCCLSKSSVSQYKVLQIPSWKIIFLCNVEAIKSHSRESATRPANIRTLPTVAEANKKMARVLEMTLDPNVSQQKLIKSAQEVVPCQLG